MISFDLSISKEVISKIGLNKDNKTYRKKEENLFSNNLIKYRGLNYFKLIASDNTFAANGASSLSLALNLLTNLTTLSLDIASQNIGCKGVESLISVLRKHTNLTSFLLNLDDRCIDEEVAALFSQQLSQLKNLNSLELNLFKNKK